MKETFYVTTPIHYVNDAPHIGHAYTTVAADTLARFNRMQGKDVRFLTGTDEHGIKIVKAAAEKGMEPKELADQVVVHFENLWRDMDMTNDDFIRTTDARHEKRVQAIIQKMVDSDDVYLGSYEGWYDEGQEEFVTETTAKENEYKSAITGKPLVKYSENNWFFRLTKWVPKLIEHIEANPGFIKPASRRNEVLSKLKMGVDDLCISRNREKLPWGIEMPNDPDHVVYVWVDALSNYYTALGLPEIGDEFDAKSSQYWPADVHLMGKDILWFHSVYWPSILLSLGVELPKCIFAHGWWTSNGQKMSKSLGNFISKEVMEELCSEYGRDILRYYMLRAVTFGNDGDFSDEMFQQIYNSELANGVGNLLSRTVKMIGKYFDGQIPAVAAEVPQAEDVRAAAAELAARAPELMENCAFNKYLDLVTDLVNATNLFIDQTQPFKLAKDETRRDELATILYTCAEANRIIQLFLMPFLPDKTAGAFSWLGAGAPTEPLAVEAQWGKIAPGTAVTIGDPLYPRKQKK